MHSIVIDLGFGDAGKGTVVEALARSNPDVVAVVRFSGGPQAAHNVVTEDGVHHTFSQFGSATLLPRIHTHLSQFMMINPGNLLREESHLQEIGVEDAFRRLSIHPDALVITPWHQAMNRLVSISHGNRAHGTTGQGIGETMGDSLRQPDSDVLRIRDLLRPDLVTKAVRIRERKLREAEQLIGIPDLGDRTPTDEFLAECATLVENVAISEMALGAFAEVGDLIFEGAQGVLLDQDYGFHPHTTWSRTTRVNADLLLNGEPAQTIGVLRAYQTRHGAGPFVTEHEFGFAEPHNDAAGWAGQFRTGHLDFVATRYAMRVSPVDALAITHLDQLDDQVKVCDGYHYKGTLPDLHPYFVLDEMDVVRRIKTPPGRISSHAHMEAVTNRLFEMKPASYLVLPKDELVPTLEEQLGKPVLLTSESPTFAGKTFRRLPVGL